MCTPETRMIGCSLFVCLVAFSLAASANDTCPDISSPWTLAISVEKSLVPPGRETDLELRLRNRSSDSIHACVCSMLVGFNSLVEAPGLLRGNISGGNCLQNRDFILPSRATLVWSETVKVPEVTSGKGNISVSLQICSEPDVNGASEKVWTVSAESGGVTYSKD